MCVWLIKKSEISELNQQLQYSSGENTRQFSPMEQDLLVIYLQI